MAAKSLGVSQPTVTQQVRALEETFSVELFHRHGRTISLTSSGQHLYGITHNIFAMTDEAIGFLVASRELKAGQLKLGTVGPAATMGLVQRYSARFPELSVSVDVGSSEPIAKGLDEFNYDVVVLASRLPSSRYHSITLGRHDVGACVHKDHPWAGRSAVNVAKLAGQRVVLRETSSSTQQAIDKAVLAANVSYGHILRVTGREAVREAVLRNMGVGVVCAVDFIPDQQLRFVRLEGAELKIEFFLTCLAARRNRPLIRKFFDVAEAAYPQPAAPTPRRARKPGARAAA